MKSKSFIAALLAVFTLGMMTSCEDMFNIDSNRVVYNPEINTTADSAYYTLGVLQCMRKVADRYVILGEVRGDMAKIDEERTKTSLRNLANFNFEADNEYLKVSDYYSIINNCNYTLAKMDTSLVLNNEPVMMDEYAALLGIRAWTYLQLAINYGKVPYYTYPVISESDVEKAYAEGNKDVKYIASDLALQLEPYLDVELPSFAGTAGSYPILRLVLADLYLWSGEYAKAKECYDEYFLNNKKAKLSRNDDNGTVMKSGYIEFGGAFMSWDGVNPRGTERPEMHVKGSANAARLEADDYISGITMETEISSGLVSEVSGLFSSAYLQPSASWRSLCADQMVFNVTKSTTGAKSIKASNLFGDMRKYPYLSTLTINDDMGTKQYDMYSKHSNTLIVTQRRTIACLRWAEAMNALAKEQFEVAAGDSAKMAEARSNAKNAFYLLKDAFKVFFPEGSQVWTDFERFHDGLQATYIGVHARGVGDVYYDTTYYVLKPEVIRTRLGKGAEEQLSFNDTIEYIDELIIDELALESTLEGNRFGDLIRFAKRREAWGDADYRHFLANRVANRGVDEETPERDEELYEKLNGSEEYWYLPFK